MTAFLLHDIAVLFFSFFRSNIFFSKLIFKRIFSKPSNHFLFVGSSMGNEGGSSVKRELLESKFSSARNPRFVYIFSNYTYIFSFHIQILKLVGYYFVVNQNGVFKSDWYKGSHKIRNFIMAGSFKSSHLVLCQSQYCLDQAISYLGKPNGNVEILYNSVDLNKFYPSREWGRQKFSFLVFGVMGCDSIPRLRCTLEAFSLFIRSRPTNSFSMTIGGYLKGGISKTLRLMIAEMGLSNQVKLQGPIARTEVCGFLRSHSVLLALKENDPCPNVVIEAMASGLCIICSRTGGTVELVHDKCSIGVSSTPSQKLVDELSIAMERSYSKIEHYSSGARNRSKMFSQVAWLDRHKCILQGENSC